MKHLRGKSFGRNIQYLHTSEDGIVEGLQDFASRFVGIDGISQDAMFSEVLHLVFHQGDERGYHDAYPFLCQGWHLECDRLATARRHKTEGIPSAGNAFNDIALNASEIGIPPVFLQNRLKFICHNLLSLIVRTDIFYLELYLVLLEDIVFDGVNNVETAAALDVAGCCTLSEGYTVHDSARL